MGDHERRSYEQDPGEKAYADAVEAAIDVPVSIEEEMLLEAAELEEITYRAAED